MRKLILVILTMCLAVILAGCSLFGGGSNINTEPLPVVNGTTAGNMLNYGFCAKHNDELLFLYTNGDSYSHGSTVRSNPDTGENSLLMEDGGLYMNIAGDVLYYCKPEGVFRAVIDDPNPELILESDVKQLQISQGNLYYIEGNTINRSTLDGEETDFSPIENADNLIVADDKLFYMSTQDGYIYSAQTNGTGFETVLEHEVAMFVVMDDIIYYLDGVTGYLVKMELDGKIATAIVEHALSGFNINRTNMYYTRHISGVSTCCNADLDGENEQQLKEFGDSKWHIVCMYDTGALLARLEDVE